MSDPLSAAATIQQDSVDPQVLPVPLTPSDAPSGNSIIVLLRQYPHFRNIALALSLVSIPGSFVILWYVWFRTLPDVWDWGLHAWALKNIPAAFAVFFLSVLPLWAPIGAVQGLMAIISLYTDAQSAKVAEVVSRGSTELEKVEDDLKASDKSGLVLLLRYSRVQLEAYYRIGLSQTQHSFRYSVVSMWIGFGVIMIGLIVRVVDLRKFGLLPPDKDVTTLVIAAGVVIEAVSALFLWVYRQSVKQLTYFYNRQMYDHTVLMCLRIADTMTTADHVKGDIVAKMMDKPWSLDQDPLPKGEALLSLGVKKLHL